MASSWSNSGFGFSSLLWSVGQFGIPFKALLSLDLYYGEIKRVLG